KLAPNWGAPIQAYPKSQNHCDELLVVIEQPGGGFLVEITPLGGGQTVMTMTYQSTQEAISGRSTHNVECGSVGLMSAAFVRRTSFGHVRSWQS
ncbi:hypothetical protein, partial [Bradyrhizobium sp. 33ap4]|uniref:hypothetical protein n=1 Tax=Bradyrhizobium sp. 33ap4 TaxID=3061630 RepID=UPI00292DD459